MSDVPHCPCCHRRDTVSVRNGHGYEYWCGKCSLVIEPDDIVDGPFIDMVSETMFDDPYDVVMNGTRVTFADECDCQWCVQVESNTIDIEQWRRKIQSNILEKFYE